MKGFRFIAEVVAGFGLWLFLWCLTDGARARALKALRSEFGCAPTWGGGKDVKP